MEKRYIGIDIGLQGIIAVMENGQIDDIYEMPITTLAKRKTVCTDALQEIFSVNVSDNDVFIRRGSQYSPAIPEDSGVYVVPLSWHPRSYLPPW